MKRLILLIITCYGLLSGYANTDTASDSLLQVLQTLPHDTTRLSTLNDIIKIEQNNYKCIQYSDSLMQEALKLKNDKYASLAAYYHLLYYYNRCEQDSVAKWNHTSTNPIYGIISSTPDAFRLTYTPLPNNMSLPSAKQTR